MIRRVVPSSSTVTILSAWGKPTWMRWRATWMPPRLETFRWTVWACGGGGGGAGGGGAPGVGRAAGECGRGAGGDGAGRVAQKDPFLGEAVLGRAVEPDRAPRAGQGGADLDD